MLLVEGAADTPSEITPEVARMLQVLSEMMPPRQAAGLVAEAFGLKKNALYEFLISR